MSDITKITIEELVLVPSKELLELQSKISTAIEAREETEKVEMAEKLRAFVAESGFTLEELTAVKIKKDRKPTSVKNKKPAKYRNPSDQNQTWTGQGAEPNWLKALTGGNKSKREDYAI